MTDGVPGHLVLNRNGGLLQKEVANSKLVAVAIDCQEGGRGQTGNGRGLGHGPANERKGPVNGLLIDGRVMTAVGAKKRPLGASKGIATVAAYRGLLVPTVTRKC